MYKSLADWIFRVYAYIFAKSFFKSFNKILFKLAIRGLGFYNYQNNHLTGEDYFINKIFNNIGPKVVFDIGANLGNYSIKLSKNPECQIYAFEPSPETVKLLQDNIRQIKNIQIVNLAVSDMITKLKFYDYANRDSSQHATLYKDIIIDCHKGQTKEYDVYATTIDAFVEEFNIASIDLLKIDVEGNEYKVLQGAKKMLQKKSIKVIQFEFNEFNSISRVFFKDIYQMLERDYKIFRLLPTGLLIIKEYIPIECEIFGYSNYIAILNDN